MSHCHANLLVKPPKGAKIPDLGDGYGKAAELALAY